MKKLRFLLLLPIFSAPLIAYYGGQTINHGHTSAAGDGGPLTNPVISGTITAAKVTVTTLTVSGPAVFSSTNVTFSNTVVSSLTANGDLNLLYGSTNSVNFKTSGGTILSLGSDTNTAILSRPTGPLALRLSNSNSNQSSSLEIKQLAGGTGDAFVRFSTSTNLLSDWLMGMDISDSGGWSLSYGGVLLSTAGGQFSRQFRVLGFGPNGLGNGWNANIIGRFDGVDPETKTIGEYLSTATLVSVNFPTSGNYGDLVSQTLPAGDWEFDFCYTANANGASVPTISIGISTVTGNSSGGLIPGNNWAENSAGPVSGATQASGCVNWRFNTSSALTYYAKYSANYTVATPKLLGTLKIRRRS